MTENSFPRCAALARQLGERPTGTASRVTAVLLIEHDGPWSQDIRERVIIECFGHTGLELLDQLDASLGLRSLIIRRPGRAVPVERPSVFIGDCRPDQHWLERVAVERHADLADLDLCALAERIQQHGGPTGLGTPVTHPLLLVCTHGRKDACCAIKGRPVANALAAEYPEQAWQCTHFGGDRWAGNLLVAPHGYMYGHLDGGSALPVAKAAQRGDVVLTNLRGRVGIAPFAQVAEIAVREHTGLVGLDDVLTGQLAVAGDEASVEVDAAGSTFQVRVRRRPLGVSGHSVCAGETRPYQFDVLGLDTTVPA